MPVKLRPLSEANRALVKSITDKLPRRTASPEEVAAVARARESIANGTAVFETTEERRARLRAKFRAMADAAGPPATTVLAVPGVTEEDA